MILPVPSKPVPSLPTHRKGAPAIRRFALILPVVFIAAAVIVASTPVQAATPRKVALGVSQYDGSRSIQAVRDFTNSVGGNKPATWTIWSTWGKKSTKKFPSAMVKKLKQEKITPMIWWEPMKRESGTCAFAKTKKIANGAFDKYIKTWARAAKKSKTKILVRYAHEINGRYFPWTVGRCGNTKASYKASWRRVTNLVRNKVGAKNVKFVWTVAKKRCPGGCNAYKPFYPGNKYVQYAGFSSFNWGDQKKWIPMEEGISLIMSKLRKFTKKPIIIAELASSPRGGPAAFADSKPDWIRTGYPAVYNKYPQVKGIVWLNVDLTKVGHPDWSLNTPNPGAIQAYRDIASQERFKGRY